MKVLKVKAHTGPAQGTPSRRDARQLDMQVVTFCSFGRTDVLFRATTATNNAVVQTSSEQVRLGYILGLKCRIARAKASALSPQSNPHSMGRA